MADTASVERHSSGGPCGPPRYAFPVAAAAIVLLLCGAMALELANRQVIVKAIGRAPARWDDPQVRAYLATWDVDPREFLSGREAALLAVAKMRPDGDVTAYVWWELFSSAVLQADEAKKLDYAWKAVQAAPHDSPRLSLYFLSWAREELRDGDAGEVVPLALDLLRRTSDATVRERIAAGALGRLNLLDDMKPALELDRQIAAAYPEATGTPAYRRNKARLLAKTGEQAEARAILEQLVATGDERQRELARQQLRELQGGGAR